MQSQIAERKTLVFSKCHLNTRISLFASGEKYYEKYEQKQDYLYQQTSLEKLKVKYTKSKEVLTIDND